MDLFMYKVLALVLTSAIRRSQRHLDSSTQLLSFSLSLDLDLSALLEKRIEWHVHDID